eukprot:15445956-Alexandrium_andersonii.AAC.1
MGVGLLGLRFGWARLGGASAPALALSLVLVLGLAAGGSLSILRRRNALGLGLVGARAWRRRGGFAVRHPCCPLALGSRRGTGRVGGPVLDGEL